jgi:hypothetical protein
LTLKWRVQSCFSHLCVVTHRPPHLNLSHTQGHGMPIISTSFDTFVLTAAVIGTSTHFILQRTQAKSQSPYRNALTLFVLLHTLYIIYVATLRYPPNLFKTLKLSINTPSDHIRSIIRKSAGLETDAVLPQPLETLLTRLSSFEGRNTFIRYVPNHTH